MYNMVVCENTLLNDRGELQITRYSRGDQLRVTFSHLPYFPQETISLLISTKRASHCSSHT